MPLPALLVPPPATNPPRKLPSIVVFAPKVSIAEPLKPVMNKPSIVQLLLPIVKPDTPAPAEAPLISISMTALSVVVPVFGVAPVSLKPSIDTGAVIAGNAAVKAMTNGPGVGEMLKSIRFGPGVAAFESKIACAANPRRSSPCWSP